MCQHIDAAEIGWQKRRMTRYLIANWKMNGDRAAVAAYATALAKKLSPAPADDLRVLFCPPMPWLEAAVQAAGKGAALAIGAQNCHTAASGAFTGETSALMLKDLGVTHVIIGHSERRAMGEDDDAVFAKAKAALTAGLTPIICVGESRAAYEAGETATVLSKQASLLKALPPGGYLLAYEPVWAIGASVTPKMAEISAAHQHLKTVLGSRAAVLYGGSVNAGNLAEILALPEVSGALIGGASLNTEQMVAMIDVARQRQG